MHIHIFCITNNKNDAVKKQMNWFTFFLISVSVSVPADLELTGDSVPSTESSLKNFKGECGEG